jgi:hypothetical protein
MHFRARLSFVVVALAGVAGLSTGCNKQGEGDRCDPLAGGNPLGTNDCQPPLVCKPITRTLNCCCPVNAAQATTSVCSAQTGSLSASPAAPDGSIETGGTVEVGDDASTSDEADGSSTGDDMTNTEAEAAIGVEDGGADAGAAE